MRSWIGLVWVGSFGLALVACQGDEGGGEDQPAGGGEPTPDGSHEEATEAETTPSPADASAGGVTIARYGDAAFTTGDRVQLARRAGLLDAPGRDAQVEAAAGKVGTISTVLDSAGLVEVTWDAQDWTVHGGYSWQGKEHVGLSDVQGATSRSAGTLHLEPFTTAVHVSYLVLFGT